MAEEKISDTNNTTGDAATGGGSETPRAEAKQVTGMQLLAALDERKGDLGLSDSARAELDSLISSLTTEAFTTLVDEQAIAFLRQKVQALNLSLDVVGPIEMILQDKTGQAISIRQVEQAQAAELVAAATNKEQPSPVADVTAVESVATPQRDVIPMNEVAKPAIVEQAEKPAHEGTAVAGKIEEILEKGPQPVKPKTGTGRGAA